MIFQKRRLLSREKPRIQNGRNAIFRRPAAYDLLWRDVMFREVEAGEPKVQCEK
jgi:hypothetical protein